MRVILNSDVVYMQSLLMHGLASHIKQFCQDMKASGVSLVLPGTVIMENERYQKKVRDDTIGAIRNAASLLRRYEIPIADHKAEDSVRQHDLTAALRETGVVVEIENATLEDYRDAERRASLHLSPQKEDAKSDEMRDLIIWAMALRIAKRDGKAILVSKDWVHTGSLGDDEADSAGLVRAKTFDDVLESVGRISPARILVRSVLEAIWARLQVELPMLPDKVPMDRFTEFTFVTDRAGHSNTDLRLDVSTSEGEFGSFAHIFQETPDTIRVNLTEVTLNKQPWASGRIDLEVKGELPKSTRSFDERLRELRDSMESI